MLKVYIASSWRNPIQPYVVRRIRTAGHAVYDFRNPKEGERGFQWESIDPSWRTWGPMQFVKGLEHPIARKSFGFDLAALSWADVTVLVMPCGNDAHLELGWAVGAGKRTAILLSVGGSELMYSMVDLLTDDLGEIVNWLG